MSSDIKKDNKSSFILFKWIFGILLFLSILFTLFVNVFLDKVIKNRIIEGVHKSSDGLYVLKIENLEAEFWTGAIAMSEVKLMPDVQDLKAIKIKDSTASIQDVKFHFDSVKISQVKWFRYLLNNEKLEIGAVVIHNPNFIINGKFKEDNGIKSSQRNFLDLLPGIIAAFTGSLRIEQINVLNGKLCYDLVGRNGLVRQSADSIKVDLKKILIDTVSRKNALYSSEAYIHMHNYSVTTPDGLHIFKIKHISGVIHDSTVVLDNLYYFQKDSGKSKYRNDFDITMRKIKGNGIDYGNLFRNQKIFIRALLLDEPAVSLHTSEDPVKKFSKNENTESQETILDELVPYLSGSFRIDNLSVDNGRVHYEIENDNLYVLQEAKNIYLGFSRVLVDSTKGSKVYAEDAILKLSNLKIYKNEVSKLDIDSLYISWGDSLLNLKTITFSSNDEDVVDIYAKEVNVRGIDYMAMFNTKKANMKSFVIDFPIINLQSRSSNKSDKKKYTSPSEFFQEALGPLAGASFRSDKFIINHADFNYSIIGDTGKLEQKANDIYVDVSNLRIDSSSVGKYDYFDSFFITLSDYELEMKDLNFNLAMKSILLDSKNKSMKMNDIRVNQLNTSGKFQRYYFTDSMSDINLVGFNYDRLIKKQQLYVNYIIVDNMKLDVCFDANKSVKPGLVREMPNELVKKLKFYLRIDSLNVRNSRILYSEKRPGIEEDGVIVLENLNGSIYNFTNDKKLMNDSNPMSLKGEAKLMGESLVRLNLQTPLLSEKFNLKYKGELLGKISINRFNKLLQNSGIEVESGEVLPSYFAVEIIGGSASGELTFVYKDFKVKMLDKERKQESKLLSLAGNFAIKNSNPAEGGELPETVSVSAIRNEEDSFIKFLWRIIRSGVSETITKSTLYKVDNGDNP